MSSKVRVLVVDDSAYARFAIARHLQSDPLIEVVGYASDGLEALARVRELDLDVLTMDVEMPRVNGLEALERIMSECPIPVVMLSTLTGEGAETTIRALELGAVDFYLKNSITRPVDVDGGADLCTKVKAAAKVNKTNLMQMEPRLAAEHVDKQVAQRSRNSGKVVVVGSSTGGPRALYDLIPALPGDLPAPVLIVQHMPPGFIRPMAERLNSISAVAVKEAVSGDELRPAQVLIAPGGYHMVMSGRRRVELNQGPPVCAVRPAVDVTMEAIAAIFKRHAIGVVLTGMGRDGTRGAHCIKAAGGKVIAQDQATCTIYGMPRSVIECGYADAVLPLSEIATALAEIVDE